MINENLDLDSKLKKIFKYLLEKEEEEKRFMENLEEMKSKINKKDLESINNWDSYKKKDLSKGIFKKVKKDARKGALMFEYSNNMVSNLIINLNIFVKIADKKLFTWCNSKINRKYANFIVNKFIHINLKKIDLYKNKIFFKVQSIVIVILDLRSLKSKAIVMNKSKCLSSLTNGMIFKKLQLKNKKYKKSEKLTYFVIKNILINNNYLNKYKNIIINIKGVKKNINNAVNYLNKKILNKNKNIIYINCTKFSNNVFFKFKKVKAIKRRLKKKLIKFD